MHNIQAESPFVIPNVDIAPFSLYKFTPEGGSTVIVYEQLYLQCNVNVNPKSFGRVE